VSRAREPRPFPIYAIADAEALAPRSLSDGARAMAGAGIRTIQLRAKTLADVELFREAERCARELEGWGGTLWIDDRVDLACLLEVDGVHLGQRDLPPGVARRLLPAGRRIGMSTHDLPQLDAAATDPAVDWVAFGPVFATASKLDPDPEVGVDGLAAAADRLRAFGARAKPLVAIGGIHAGNVARVLAAGAGSAAVLSAVCAGDVEANCRRLLAALAA
jgi:thiamine-phosphate pyrophosphorylase